MYEWLPSTSKHWRTNSRANIGFFSFGQEVFLKKGKILIFALNNSTIKQIEDWLKPNIHFNVVNQQFNNTQ
jgi:hypothetical protein